MKPKNHSIDFLFALLMFLLYAGSMIAFVYMGAEVYQSVTGRMNNRYDARTAQSYITEKVRQNDCAGCVDVGEIEGEPALVLRQTVEGQDYVTYIYTHEGMLKELFTAADRQVSWQDGTELLELAEFHIEEAGGGLLKAAITDNEGLTRIFWIYRESEEA